MAPLIIDVEASGFGRGSYPIEVGLAMPNGDSHCMIIRPQPEWQHWDETAAALHGISRATLNQFGREPQAVALQLNQWLAGAVVYSDAWGNDSSWLGLLFDSVDLVPTFKLESLRSLLTETQVELWHSVKDKVVAQNNFRRHRASNDAMILQQTYAEIVALTASHCATVQPDQL